MRARAVVGSVAASLGVLAIGWQFGALANASNALPTALGTVTTTTTGANTATTSTATPTPSSTAATGSTPAATTPATTTAGGAKDGTYTGQAVGTQFGSVQVQVTISGGSISEVKALKLTDSDGRSVQISNRAAPTLRSEVLSGQTANVQFVGGATYTSYAYLQSVQSALDQAGYTK